MPPPDRPADLSPVERFDELVDGAFEQLRGQPVLDRLFYSASALGDFSLIWYLIGSVKSLASDDHPRDLSRLAVILAGESVLVNQGVKRLFRRDRPRTGGSSPHRIRQPSTSAFPSGHASAAFVAAAVLSEGSRLAPAYYGLAAIVAVSRVHVRIHHASDVLGGALLGIALGALARRAWPRRAE
jgi:undecaprenyl-diphosphatase